MHRTFLTSLALVLSLLILPTPAYAYLDPGTGSFILQMLVAGALGAMLYIKMAWSSTKDFFRRLFSGGGADISEPDEVSEAAETKQAE